MSENILNKKRSAWADFVKGIAIILVVYGHVIQIISQAVGNNFFENIVMKLICSIHMPLFACVSGYFWNFTCRKKGIFNAVKKRVISILEPMCIWILIYYAMIKSIEFLSTSKINFSIKEYMAILKGNYYWFLWSIVILCVVVGISQFLCCKLKTIFKAERENVYMIQMILISGILIMVCKFLPNYQYTLYLFPFFIVGYICFENSFIVSTFNKYNKFIIFISLISYGVLMLFWKQETYIYISGADVFTSSYGIWKQFLINTFRSCVGVCGVIAIVSIVILNEKNL